MGFRSVMLTADRAGVEVPASFFEKYEFLQSVHNKETNKYYLPLASTVERKFYDDLEDTQVFKDIQELLKKSEYQFPITVILLHECEGITKIEIHTDKIVGLEPTEWKKVDRVEHNYCYGYSDHKNIEDLNEPIINPYREEKT